ncbi:accessory Sec-dependent serine-rich glycoprotein adhesin [Streptococcus iniae]|nr:accessory Sec-dependent serine-rich glycoprotein adhesin [Streptococcus iniae]
MLKQKHQYQESSRQTRVKMHKSGKNWVRTVVSNIGLLRFFKGLATQDIKVQALEDDIQKHSHAVSLLRGIAATGAMLGGSLVLADHVMAEEVTGATEQPLTMTDTVTMDTVTVTETSPSTTETVKDNQERSSLSSSESQSQSLSNSESASASQVALASETATPSLLQPRAMVSAATQGSFEPVPLALAAEAETETPSAIATTGKDVTANISNPMVTFSDSNLIEMDKGGYVSTKLNFSIQDISPGDFISVSLSNTLDGHGISLNEIEFPILNENNELIAVGKYDDSTHNIKYIFTDIVQPHSNIKASAELSLFIDDQTIPNTTSNVKISLTLGNQIFEKVVDVKYEIPLQHGNYNVDSRIIKANFTDFSFKYVTQINPLGKLISTSNFSPLVSVIQNADQDSHIDLSKVNYKIYKLIGSDLLSESMNEDYLNTNKFEDVTQNFRSEFNSEANARVIYWDKSYIQEKFIIVVEGSAEKDSKTL